LEALALLGLGTLVCLVQVAILELVEPAVLAVLADSLVLIVDGVERAGRLDFLDGLGCQGGLGLDYKVIVERAGSAVVVKLLISRFLHLTVLGQSQSVRKQSRLLSEGEAEEALVAKADPLEQIGRAGRAEVEEAAPYIQ